MWSALRAMLPGAAISEDHGAPGEGLDRGISDGNVTEPAVLWGAGFSAAGPANCSDVSGPDADRAGASPGIQCEPDGWSRAGSGLVLSGLAGSRGGSRRGHAGECRYSAGGPTWVERDCCRSDDGQLPFPEWGIQGAGCERDGDGASVLDYVGCG